MNKPKQKVTLKHRKKAKIRKSKLKASLSKKKETGTNS
jgi:hypothetical protein